MPPSSFPFPRDPGESGKSRVQLFYRSCRPIPLFPQLLDNTSQVHVIPLAGDCIKPHLPLTSRYSSPLLEKAHAVWGLRSFVTEGLRACPVRGCVHRKPLYDSRRSKFMPLAVVSPTSMTSRLGTFCGRTRTTKNALNAILRGKRESRMGHEHSEDAVTWNVFRFFERHGCLAPAMKDDLPAPESEPLTIFWTTHEDRLWEPYRLCSDQIPEKATAAPSPISFSWDKAAGHRSRRNFARPTAQTKQETRRRTAQIPTVHRARLALPQPGRRGRRGALRVVRTLAELGAGHHAKDTLGCEAFVLVNLVRKRHEKELARIPDEISPRVRVR